MEFEMTEPLPNEFMSAELAMGLMVMLSMN